MGADVAIPEREPGGLHPVRGKLLHHLPALGVATPTAYSISATTQRVHDRVKVRADAESVQRDVVSGVGDHGEPCSWICVAYPQRKLRAADATGQDHDLHRTSVAASSLLARRPGKLVSSSLSAKRLRRRLNWLSAHVAVPLLVPPITSGRLSTLAEVVFSARAGAYRRSQRASSLLARCTGRGLSGLA